jgi:rhodanese-related sulfurtransferase
MDIAVPANLACGRPADGHAFAGEPDWAPLAFTFGGVWEIEPAALAECLGKVLVLDVREPAEFDDALGHIPGARLLPLSEVAAAAATLPKDRPLVTVCRAGGRSAQASLVLSRAGHPRVANLAGGMLRWRAEGQAVEGEHH